MNGCKVCGMEIPDDRTMCVPCLKKTVDKVYEQFEEWKRYAEELKKERLFDLRKCINETICELQRLEVEKGKLDIQIGDTSILAKLAPTCGDKLR